MKRLVLAALVLVWIALPVCAQHVSAHGASSGHSAPAFHSAPSAPVSRGFSGHPSYAPRSRSFNAPRAPQGAWISRSGARPPYLGPSHPGSPSSGSRPFRRPYYSGYRPLYGYGGPVWIAPYFLADPEDAGDDGSATAENTVSPGYDDQSGLPENPDAQEPPPWPGAPYISPQAQPSRAANAETEEMVTLIFKDGRTPEQIHNYILTKDTLFVGDQYHRQIPIDQLDLSATVQVNRDLGVDFHLPAGSR